MKKIEPIEPIERTLSEYDILREQKKLLESRIKDLSDRIKQYATQHGVRDDKGSYYLENDEYTYGSVSKKTITFNATAIPFFKSSGLSDCIRVIEEVDDEAVEKRISDGTLSMEDIEDITDVKISYSVLVKKRDEIVEADTGSIAASSASKFFPKAKRK